MSKADLIETYTQKSMKPTFGQVSTINMSQWWLATPFRVQLRKSPFHDDHCTCRVAQSIFIAYISHCFTPRHCQVFHRQWEGYISDYNLLQPNKHAVVQEPYKWLQRLWPLHFLGHKLISITCYKLLIAQSQPHFLGMSLSSSSFSVAAVSVHVYKVKAIEMLTESWLGTMLMHIFLESILQAMKLGGLLRMMTKHSMASTLQICFLPYLLREACTHKFVTVQKRVSF